MKELKLSEPTDPNRPSIFKLKDGRVSYRASELGRCIRALSLARMGYLPEEPDEKSLRIMNEGNIHEPWAARWWQENNGGTLLRQVRISLNIGTNVVVSGTSDGLWFPDSEQFEASKFSEERTGTSFDPDVAVCREKLHEDTVVFGVEIKAPGDSSFDDQVKNGPSPTYKMQISVYWAAMEENLGVKLSGFVFILRRRSDGLHHHIVINEPYFSRQQIEERINEVERLSAMGYDAAECDTKDWFCKYWRHHKDDSGNIDASYDPSLTDLMESYSKISEEMEVLERRKSALKEQLELGMRGRKKVKAEGYTAFYSSRSHIDETLLLHENPEMEKLYTRFDSDKCLEENPDMKKRYKVDGKPFLVVRSSNKKSSEPKFKKLENTDPTEVLKHLLNEKD